MTAVTDKLDPATLRWVADEMHKEAVRAAKMEKRATDEYRDDASKFWGARARDRKTLVRSLRTRATRIENTRKRK